MMPLANVAALVILYRDFSMMLQLCPAAVVTLSVMSQHFSIDVATLHFCFFSLNFYKNTNLG